MTTLARSFTRRVAYLQVSLAAMGWGTWSLFLRPAKVDPRWASTILLSTVALTTLPLLFRANARGPRDRRASEWWAIVAMGVFDAANVALFFGAMSVTTVAIAVLSHYLAPILVALAAPRFIGSKRQPGALKAACVALLGLAIVLEPWNLGKSGAGQPLLGALLGAASAAFYAANVLITKRVGPRFTAEEQLSLHAVLAALILAVAAWFLHTPLPALRGALIVAGASIAIGAIGGLVFLRGLQKIPAEHAAILTFLEPLAAVLVAWVAFHEVPSALAALGAALVVGSGAKTVWDAGRA